MPLVDTSGGEWRAVRLLPSRAQAEEWALVLAAAGIAHRVEPIGHGWQLVVPVSVAGRAETALDAYARDTATPDHSEPRDGAAGGAWAAIVVAALLLAFYLVCSTAPEGSRWVLQGSAAAARIADGEWWRTITALTLHADVSHALNNAITFAIFGGAVCHWFGVGVGLSLILLGGAIGNALNAVVRGAPHSALGASTAVFAAIGILAAVQFHRRSGAPAYGALRARAWAPVAAGLALLAMLGSSEHADVLAHLFGFASGGVIGVVAVRRLPHPIEPRLQHALIAATLLCVCAAWALALQ